jgi:DNA-binding transcriptional regulator GbsR (MarR family)
MSFGFQREETNYLGLEDFASQTNMARTHLSKALKRLVQQKVIIDAAHNGHKHKYAINLLQFSVTMKGYEMSNKGDIIRRKADKISNEDDQIDSRKDKFRNSKSSENDVSNNKSSTYDNDKSGYKKNDKKSDKKLDIHLDSCDQWAETLVMEYLMKEGITVDNILKYMIQLDNTFPEADRSQFKFCYTMFVIYDGYQNGENTIKNEKYEKMFKEACQRFYELRDKKFCPYLD